MNISIINTKFYIVLLHVFFGMIMLNPIASKSLNILVLFVGFMTILYNNNKNNEALLWSAYVVGSEVLFRMSKGLILYEFPKYMVFLFLITGLIVEKRIHKVSEVYILYILLLLFGITFSEIPFPESIRTNIIFNLSGPILLGLCAIYSYKRVINMDTMLNLIYYMALPIISLLVYLYLETPDLRYLHFSASSNRITSGGFGPNQVATSLGLGIFCFGVSLLYKKRISGYFIFDILIIIYLVYRALLTMSRGGFITGVVAISVFVIYYVLTKKDSFLLVLKYGTIALLMGLVIGTYTSNKTKGMLLYRYTNRNTRGEVANDLTTGRFNLIKSEFAGFLESPFVGIGVGSGKYRRIEETNVRIASHNEMSRLLGEHGAIGLIIIILLITVPISIMYRQPYRNKAFLNAFLIFWFLTINHSAMRLAMPAFLYGLSVLLIANARKIKITESSSE